MVVVVVNAHHHHHQHSSQVVDIVNTCRCCHRARCRSHCYCWSTWLSRHHHWSWRHTTNQSTNQSLAAGDGNGWLIVNSCWCSLVRFGGGQWSLTVSSYCLLLVYITCRWLLLVVGGAIGGSLWWFLVGWSWLSSVSAMTIHQLHRHDQLTLNNLPTMKAIVIITQF